MVNTGNKTITHNNAKGTSLDDRFAPILTQIRQDLLNRGYSSKEQQQPFTNPSAKEFAGVNDSIDANDKDRFGTYLEQAKILNSDKTILTNDEILAIKPFTGNDTKPRIAVASEHTDPVFFSKMI
nr:MAG TPA: hypothetical protein [Bacteriophage sp.]